MKKTRNRFEKKIERQLKKAKVKFEYESERITYLLSGYYLPDFVIHTSLGKIYIETKGYFRPDAKRKLSSVKKLHPELDIRLLFYGRNKQNEKWCIKHGFRYAFEDIPVDWLLGL